MMNRHHTILLAALSLAACTADYTVESEANAPETEKRTSTTEIPVGEAVAALNRFLDSTDPVTRGGRRRTIARVDRVSAADMFPSATRSGSEMPEVGDLLYVVNFSNDEGYAVLGADSRLDTILIVGDNGSFDPSILESPKAEDLDLGNGGRRDSIPDGYFDPTTELGGLDPGIGGGRIDRNPDDPTPGQEQETEPTLDSLYCAEYDEYYIGSSGSDEDLVVGMLHDYTQRQIIWDIDKEEIDGAAYTPPIHIAPLLKTTWHQHTPYNSKFHFAPPSDKDRAGKQRPAGCTTIAAAQILVCRKDLDLKAKFGITDTTWENMENFIINPQDYKAGIFSGNSLYNHTRSGIASLIKQIADGIGVKYNYNGSGGTFALPSKVKKYLKRLGYDVDKYTGFKKKTQDKIVSSLSKGHPVFIGALESNCHGHAWVIDGCKYHHESNNYFNHCNFGWTDGSSNGWYYYNLFNITTGCESLDSGNSPDPQIVGVGITPESGTTPGSMYFFMENQDGDSFAYTWCFRILIIN